MKNQVGKKIIGFFVLTVVFLVMLSACQEHTHVFGSAEIVKEATCTEFGLAKSVCSCGEEKTENIPQTNHESAEWIIGSEATCNSEGLKYKECVNCGDKFQLETIDKLSHNVIKHDGRDSTCTDIGFNSYEECTLCEYTTYVEIPRKSHTASATIDCTTPQFCAVCGVKLNDAAGHKEVVLTGVAATCTTDGITDGKKCSVCQKILVAQTEIHKKGHSYTDERDEICNACGFTRTVVERYSVISLEDMSNKPRTTYIALYDNDYEYHVFYLGRVENVPLQKSTSVYKHNGNDYRKSFVSAVITEEEIKEIFTTMEETSVTHSVEVSSTRVKGAEIYGIVAALEQGISVGTSVSEISSQSKSIENTINYSISQSEETSFDFDETKAQGYYRYILMGSVDVYGVLRKSLSSGQYSTGTYNVIASQYYTLDYSKTSTFDERSAEKLDFELEASELSTLVTPTIYVGNGIAYDSGYKAKKIDASHEYTYDEFDISDLSNFFTADYVLTFDVKVYMKEESAGYQEIYLCKQNETHVAGVDNYEHGGSGKANTSYAWATFNWKISGDQCTNIMKLRYGAHGDSSDDWYRAHAKVQVSISKAK